MSTEMRRQAVLAQLAEQTMALARAADAEMRRLGKRKSAVAEAATLVFQVAVKALDAAKVAIVAAEKLTVAVERRHGP